jgi:aminobenzoyl-glutamate utilization protein B
MIRHLLVLFSLLSLPAAAQLSVLREVESRAEHFGKVSRTIWENPETGFQEVRSAALLRDELKTEGFRITEGIGGMPTAFIAEWGSGAPIIGIIGEYDGLPGLSQEDIAQRKARVEGAPGHGCGHNLFGSASALAAISVRRQMEKEGLKGTIRFYGTPAEEGGGGKIYMIRAGAFRDADVVLAWHPFDRNQSDNNPWLANISAKIRYKGRAAHAAGAPDAGRSALDGIEIMTHALNLMREHVPQETRMHYVITKGGDAANIVPENAELSIIVRHPNQKSLESIWEWALNCAQAGALASGTTMSFEVTSAYANMVHTSALVQLLDRSLRTVGGVQYTPEERAFAEELRKQVPDLSQSLPLGSESEIQPPRTELFSASTDVGDVSWVVPMGHFLAATFPSGTPLHTWMSTACAGTSLGRKGMVVAAKTLALSATELFANPQLVQQVKADWAKAMQGQEYRSLVPADRKPTPR